MNRRQSPRDITDPQPGLFRVTLCRGGPPVAASITRTLGMLTAEINGVPCAVSDVWESGTFIDWPEWNRLDTNRPSDPLKPVDFRSLRTF